MKPFSLKEHILSVGDGLFGEKQFWPYSLLIILFLIFADQFTKRTIMEILPIGFSVKAMPGLWFTHVQNTGAVWGTMQDFNTILIVVSILVFFVLVYFYNQFKTTGEKIAFAIIMAGIWGNLLDRFMLGYVVDFINLGWWPVFNIADSCIVVGVLIFLLDQLDQRRNQNSSKSSSLSK